MQVPLSVARTASVPRGYVGVDVGVGVGVDVGGISMVMWVVRWRHVQTHIPNQGSDCTHANGIMPPQFKHTHTLLPPVCSWEQQPLSVAALSVAKSSSPCL